jgi:hypothetical protein
MAAVWATGRGGFDVGIISLEWVGFATAEATDLARLVSARYSILGKFCAVIGLPLMCWLKDALQLSPRIELEHIASG